MKSLQTNVDFVPRIFTSLTLSEALLTAAIIGFVTWVFVRSRRGGDRDTTITFGRTEIEPLLDDAPLIQPLEDGQWDNARAVIPELIDVLTVMERNLDGLDGIDYRSLAHQSGVAPSSVRQVATQTFGRIRHLNQATVQFLPDDLSQAWHALLHLLEDLRRFGPGSSEPWSDSVLNRNRRDVLHYVGMVRTALIEFATSGAIATYCEPPDLRRSDLEDWEPR
jgi:hypothetical protein